MSKFIDMTNTRIDNFVVIERANDSRTGITRWRCLCDCGEYFECEGSKLRSCRHPTSCPKCAIKLKSENRIKVLTGQKFGKLTVEGIIRDKDDTIKQVCRCECGCVTYVQAYNLLNGIVKSCGKPLCRVVTSKKGFLPNSRVVDITNERFGRLIATEYDFIQKKWRCRCDCGNIACVSKANLTSGATKSCGCLHKDLIRERTFEDLSCLRFGYLTVLSLVESKNSDKTKWVCQCDCGNKTVVSSCDLKAGKQLSCGCVKSKGEYKISQYLLENEVVFESQKIFDELKGVGNRNLSYDFYLPKYNLLIEYQGVQHYAPFERFGGVEKYKIQLEHDKRKREYALAHNYNLYEINYKQLDKIEEILSSLIKEE